MLIRIPARVCECTLKNLLKILRKVDRLDIAVACTVYNQAFLLTVYVISIFNLEGIKSHVSWSEADVRGNTRLSRVTMWGSYGG